MGAKLNLNLGDRRIKADSFELSLEPNIIRIIKILAQQSAEEDFEQAIKNNRH